jgi:capsular exopolysaccharide synthesis family protein
MPDNVQLNRNARPMPMRPQPQAQAGITPKEIISIVRRHVLLIIIMAFLGTVVGGGGWFVMKRLNPKYTARTAIDVKAPGEKDPMAFSSSMPNKDLYYQFRNTLASYMRQQSFRQELLKKQAIKNTNWYKQFDHNIADAVESLQNNLGASPQKDGNWIVMSMTCKNAKESALIVNEAANLFVQIQKDRAQGGSSDQLETLEKQRLRIESDLKIQESNLTALRTTYTEFENLEATTFRNYRVETIGNSESSRNELEGRIAQVQTTIDLLEKRLEGEYDEIVREQVERDNTAVVIRQRVTFLEQDLAQTLSRFGERHRRVRELQRQKTQEKYRDLNIAKAEYAKIITIRDEKRASLEKINGHIEKLNALHDDPELSKVGVAFAAPVPLRMSLASPITYAFGGFMMGMLAGLGLAFAIEMLNDLLRTPQDIAKHLKIPILGAICHASEDKDTKGIDLYQVIRQAPYSMMSECYRQMRTNIRLSDSGSSKKVLLVTSPGVGCGKTSVALNLIATLAAEGQKVLFIDTHFRNPITPTIFPRTESDGTVMDSISLGLSNYLLAQCEQQDVIRESGIDGLDIIDSGPLPSNPAEIFGGAIMNRLLEDASHDYDYVIIDGPPMIVTSAKVLASQAEGTIVVFNTSLTKRGQAQRTLRELKEVNANIIGTVLVGVRAMKGGYFHERYSAYRKYQNTQIPAAV